MKRYIILFLLLSLIVSILAFPASAAWEDSDVSVIDYLDYVDSDHLEIDSNQSYVVINLPADYAESVFVQDADGHFSNGESDDVYIPSGNKNIKYLCFPTLDYQYTIGRTNKGYLFDTSNFPAGTTISWEWEVDFSSYPGTIENNLGNFEYFTYFFGVPDQFGMSYMLGRTSIFGLPAYADSKKIVAYCEYEHGGDTVGTATKYVAPCIRFSSLTFSQLPANFTVKTSSIKVTIPITDDLIDFAQNEKTQKLLDEISRQLEDQGQTMDDILEQQQQTNDKIDDMTGYEPTPDNPDFQDSVDDLEDIEQGALDNVQDGMDDADEVFTSVFDVLGDYLQSFAAVSIIFETFADLPFFSALLAVSLALGIVAALLGIGLDAVRSSSRSSARSSKKGG